MTIMAPGTTAAGPGRFWYVVAGLVLVAGTIGAVSFGFSRFALLDTKLTQVVVPGEATLQLKDVGHHLIFHERESVIDGRVYSSRGISGLHVTLRRDGGEMIPLSRPSGTSTYHFSGRSGVAVFQFDIKEPGTYRLSANYDDGRNEPRTVLAVDHGFLGDLLTMIFGAIGIAFLGVLLAVAIAVIVFVKRRRAARPIVVSPGARTPTVS